jgi:hypothetical protein
MEEFRSELSVIASFSTLENEGVSNGEDNG